MLAMMVCNILRLMYAKKMCFVCVTVVTRSYLGVCLVYGEIPGRWKCAKGFPGRTATALRTTEVRLYWVKE